MPRLIKIALLLGIAAGGLLAQEEDEGKHTFASTCAACHALDGKGGERGPDIATRQAIQGLPDSSLWSILRNGKPGTGMPSFRSLGEPRIQAVVRHLRRLQGQVPVAVLPGEANAGKILFFGTAECSRCHTANGEGGFIASDLSTFASDKNALEIHDSITEPNKNLDPKKRTVLARTSEGTILTGIARNEDNFSLQLQTLDGAFHFLNKSDLLSLEHQPSSLMPDDNQSRLTSRQLDDLVSYLMSIAQSHPQSRMEKE